MGNTEDEMRIDQVFLSLNLLKDAIGVAVNEAVTSLAEVGNQADTIHHMLWSVIRLDCSLYGRPFLRIAADVSKNLKSALTLIRKCKRRSILRRIVTIVTQADFRKIQRLLDASIGDLRWLRSIFDYDVGGGSIELSLPPIVSNDPVLAWVWSFIAAIHFGPLSDQMEAATELASLAQDNDRNKKIIAEEGGVVPLLKLLNHGSSADAQIAAATALFHLANIQERVRLIAQELDIQMIIRILGEFPMRVQIWVANLVARMAEHDPVAKEEFGRTNVFIRSRMEDMIFRSRTENVISLLVTLVSSGNFVDARINKEIKRTSNLNYRRDLSSPLSSYWDSNHKIKNESVNPVVQHKLKISCAEALWMLASDSVANSRRITETKGLLCLAKLIENEPGDLQFYCLMTIMAITAAAESNAELRRAAFKTNSPAAKSVVDQLLRVIEAWDIPSLQLPAVRSIGSLARTFPSRATRVIGPLVELLSHANQDVATEAAISLGKFACPENYICFVHSKTIIEFDGVPPLMRLLRSGDRPQLHGLILLCYLAMHAGDSEALEAARVLTALEGAADRAVAALHPKLKELVPQAIYHLQIHRTGAHPHRPSYVP
ncbi:ARMADILLO BTB PROTEIN like [Actinidia chinensis var. chinensis]|uniref:ARMADILLO BTB PROTEIN like n=1 Tax=Actinidia chinensis var. chinensis TaxID=1590841 RepID=A0A2R6RER7_ACTCC|nr:ARMADILLO BTB PROTEIN like [Actinidia chinensis var. chinensis]